MISWKQFSCVQFKGRKFRQKRIGLSSFCNVVVVVRGVNKRIKKSRDQLALVNYDRSCFFFCILAHTLVAISRWVSASTRLPCSTFVESVKITNCKCMKWIHTLGWIPGCCLASMKERTHVFNVEHPNTKIGC